MNIRFWIGALALTGSALSACGSVDSVSSINAKADEVAVFEGPVATADCGDEPLAETDLQGRVPIEDRTSGRSQLGYRCNMELVGQYQGQGTSWVSQSYGHCAYHSQTVTSILSATPGVHVVDVSDPANPVLSERLTSPAFLGNTWETLKVNEARGLLAGVQVGPILGAAFFDVYDISADCAHPKLLNSLSESQLTLPANTLGHEGDWSPDGMTYWATSASLGVITAIDVADPASPRIVFVGTTSFSNHGFEISPDGNRLYIAQLDANGVQENGVAIFDVSEVQQRKPLPQIRKLGSVTWADGSLGQHSVVVSWGGKPYLIFVDEGSSGVARIIDISDEMAPRVVSKLKLQIHMPEHAELRSTDTAGNGIPFGYDGHYCEVDRREDPTAVACGYFQSGIRVFDIRDPMSPREIAYFNPPAQVGKKALLTGSEHASSVVGVGANLTADWCSSPPRFVEQPDGTHQIWVTCQDNGFMVLKFTNGAYPIVDATPVPELPPVVAAIANDHSRFGGAMGWAGLLPLVLVALRSRRALAAALLLTFGVPATAGDHEHHHGALEVSGPAPSVELRATPDSMHGWNLQLITQNFRFAPEHAGSAHAAGEGHAHLYVDGRKAARIYGNWFHLDDLKPGKHRLRVTLNANSHEELHAGGKPIEAVAGIVQP